MVNPKPLLTSRWRRARWLVLAPHPDDETLGAGALIAHAACTRRLAGIIFLTDGTGSHPADTPRLAAVRRSEARHAIRRLGAKSVTTKWMGWRDAHPFATGSARFERDALRLAAVIRRERVDAIAVSDRTDSHCDHVAAYDLAWAAAGLARRTTAVFGYHVWSVVPAAGPRFATPPMRTGHRRQALCAHRSQLSPVLGRGFQIPRERLRMPPRDIFTLRRSI